MKWSELSYPWQICFEESLSAYRAGTVPVGALVLDGEGRLLSRARNRIYDQHAPEGQISTHKLAHAELNAILSLRIPNTDFRNCTLFTSLEPCPLCMGAIYMAGIRKIHFAARDPYAGSVDILDATPYFSRKQVQAIHAGTSEFENLLIGLNTEFGLRGFYDHVHDFFNVWAKVLPTGVNFGHHLFEQNFFENLCAADQTAAKIFEFLSDELKRMEQN